MGVESSKETASEESSFLKNVMAIAFIKGKVVLTGVLFTSMTGMLALHPGIMLKQLDLIFLLQIIILKVSQVFTSVTLSLGMEEQLV